ncbi:MAG: hypothetical protein QOE61_5763 [Micromonosporaceae bacterium]|nr:hypothetical protein [Micromonosporaceae bacterium]
MDILGILTDEHEYKQPQPQLLPLAEAPAALDRVRAGYVRGKLVLETAPAP